MKVLTVNSLGGFKGGIEKLVYVTAGMLSRNGYQVYGLFEHRFNYDSLFASVFEEVYALDSDPLDRIIKELKALGIKTVIIHKIQSLALLTALQREFHTVVFVHDHDYYCMRHHKYVPLLHLNCNLHFNLCRCSLCSMLVDRGEPGAIPSLFNPWHRMQLLHRIRRCDRFIVLSDFMRHNLADNGFPLDRIVKINPPAAPAAEPPPFSGARNLLFAGPLLPGKGVDLLLKALTRVKSCFTLRIVGSGSEKSRLIRQTLESNLSEKVEFMDYVDDLSLEYKRADIVVVPSRWQEPFGLIGIEAFCNARPVVAFLNGGIGEWLRDGWNGLAVKPGDIDNLTEKIEFLLTHPEEAETMGHNGWNMVKEEYHPNRFLAALNALLEDPNV